jgi:hypothetical protein
MSEKHLTEPPWKALVAKHGLKDLGLQKGLAAHAKLDEAKQPTEALASLKEMLELVLKLKKTLTGKADVTDHLDEMVKELKKQTPALEVKAKAAQKAAEQAAAQADKDKNAKAKEDEREEEDAEAAAELAAFKKDLKSEMTSALSQVRQRAPGEPGQGKQPPKPQLKFMSYVAGKFSSVIIARKVGASTKKLLLEIAANTAGGKYYTGDCIFEKNTHTFVLEVVPGGLAAKLSAALFAATGSKVRVRVRSLDGKTVLDSDADGDAGGDAPGTPGGTGTGTSLVALQQTRLGWEKTRNTIQSELKKLEASIVEACQADEEVGAETIDLTRLNRIMDRLDTRLIAKLDEALNAQEPALRAQLNQQAKAIVGEYMAFVNEDPLMADVDDSGFVAVAVRKTALASLTLLSSKL